jgi:Fic family protein
MLIPSLLKFNTALAGFQKRFPTLDWTETFKSNLINDYSFYSARLEDDRLQYGDTIKFLNGELVRKGKMLSLLDVSNHKEVLQSMINRYDTFELTEDTIKAIHADLMNSELSWEGDFQRHLVGNYRNVPTIGFRQPYFPNKEYAPHYNLEVIMPSAIEQFTNRFRLIDSKNNDTHLITALAYFHNKFLNEIHPFADGNGRVCRIIMGIIMMKNNCPPIFAPILSNEDSIEYITKIVECEEQKSNLPLINFLAEGMAEYLQSKLQ